MDQINKDFSNKYGYYLCRCYSCVFPLLVAKYKEVKDTGFSKDILGKLIEEINNDYLECANFKMGVHSNTGLSCGYDCRHYEERIEACPFTFWAYDKNRIEDLIALLESDEFISIFSE